MRQAKKNGNGNLSGIVVGTLVGAAVGAGVALLCAPRSGEETRELLAEKARELRNRTSRAVEQGQNVVRREAKAITSDIKEVARTL
ncbi:MAG TPA: YtxH domain-containing protein [Patescibacteria group bacterium]|jgi:gas vesicle protein|nr:YtxH domain-containing protein [Patescibacteria group bacterium]